MHKIDCIGKWLWNKQYKCDRILRIYFICKVYTFVVVNAEVVRILSYRLAISQH